MIVSVQLFSVYTYLFRIRIIIESNVYFYSFVLPDVYYYKIPTFILTLKFSLGCSFVNIDLTI